MGLLTSSPRAASHIDFFDSPLRIHADHSLSSLYWRNIERRDAESDSSQPDRNLPQVFETPCSIARSDQIERFKWEKTSQSNKDAEYWFDSEQIFNFKLPDFATSSSSLSLAQSISSICQQQFEQVPSDQVNQIENTVTNSSSFEQQIERSPAIPLLYPINFDEANDSQLTTDDTSIKVIETCVVCAAPPAFEVKEESIETPMTKQKKARRRKRCAAVVTTPIDQSLTKRSGETRRSTRTKLSRGLTPVYRCEVVKDFSGESVVVNKIVGNHVRSSDAYIQSIRRRIFK